MSVKKFLWLDVQEILQQLYNWKYIEEDNNIEAENIDNWNGIDPKYLISIGNIQIGFNQICGHS